MYSYGPPHMAVQKQDDQHEHIFSSYVRIQDVVLKTCLGRWTIGRSGERGSGISVLPVQHDDDDWYAVRWSAKIGILLLLKKNTIQNNEWIYYSRKKPFFVSDDIISIVKPVNLGFHTIFLFSHIVVFHKRLLWCNRYHCRKWTQSPEFKILDEAVCISHNTDTLGKGMNPTILSPTMSQFYVALAWQFIIGPLKSTIPEIVVP